MLSQLRRRAKWWISDHRHSAWLKPIHQAAGFFEDAYANAWPELDRGGEAGLVRRLSPAQFRTVFDVGANTGEWTAIALRAWPHASLHAFEVSPPTAEQYARQFCAPVDRERITLNASV